MNGCTNIETHVAKRVVRNCDWCWQHIKIGDTYRSYRFYDGGHAYTVYLHPECYDASTELARQEGGWCEWTPGQERPRTEEVVK